MTVSGGVLARRCGVHQARPSLPQNWRSILPAPADYYCDTLKKVGSPNANGWAMARCPFHDDRHRSLSICLSRPEGHWRCFAGCGYGDLVSFHMLLRNVAFLAAVRELIGLRQ